MSQAKRLTPQMLVWAYRQGVFPMARGRRGPVDWYDPPRRGVLPLDSFHVPRRLGKQVRRGEYQISFDLAFERVIRVCSMPRPGHPDTWISAEIVSAYVGLHESGLAHSIEAWRDNPGHDPELVGGVYGVSLGGAFFGESMFSRATNVSKICLVHLVEHLRGRGYTLFDTQFLTPHLQQFGALEISRAEYHQRLERALEVEAVF